MKKIAVLMMVLMLTVLASVSMAGEEKIGKLFLFQKCALTQTDPTLYDSFGCPLGGDKQNGPWPIFLKGARGEMDYNLLGDKFKFSFKGEKLQANTNYTLIYYPDQWPGAGLICLDNGVTNDAGKIKMDGKVAITDDSGIPSGLPVKYDKNFNPVSPSGAAGAKIWLVSSDDVTCTGATRMDAKMVAWNPTEYLFEDNLIVYQLSTNEPPIIKNASAIPSVLWPPNHKMRVVYVNYKVEPPDTECQLSVTSNESISSSDYAIVDAHHVKLIAERLGTGTGRIYTITITCGTATKDVAVTVPHDKGKK
jgi:hypothetical protein